MADYFCDHGAYGLASNRLGLDTPTWGVPQEGDGSSKDAATAVSIGSIVLNALPAATNLLSICGISFGATSGGTVNYTIGATITATVDNIVAAINGCTTAVGASVALGVPQLRNLVFARNSGGTTVELMMRIGSAKLNYVTNANVAMTYSGWATAPTITNFTGGSGGCWGWFINPTAIGSASSIALGTYGAFLALPYVGSAMTIADTIYVRTGGGASKTISIAISAVTWFVHAAFSKNIVFDTNTIWVGDTASGVLKLSVTQSAWNIQSYLKLASPGYEATYTALSKGGFEFEYVSAQTSGNLSFSIGAAGGTTTAFAMSNCTLRDSTSNGCSFTPFIQTNTATAYQSILFENCRYIVSTARATMPATPFACGFYGTVSEQRFIGCSFDFNISGVSDPGALISCGYVADTDLLFRGCQFLGFATGYNLIAAVSAWATDQTRMCIVVDNCSGLKMPSTYVGLPASVRVAAQKRHSLLFSNLLSGNPGFRAEDMRGVCEWVPGDTFPTAGALLTGLGTEWSLRVIWLSMVALTECRTYEAIPLRMIHSFGSGVRDLSVLMFIPSSVVSGVKVSFNYMDSAGVARNEIASVIQSDSTTWTNAGIYAGYNAKKFALTTSYPVLATSEIVATLILSDTAPATQVNLYIHPEIVVS